MVDLPRLVDRQRDDSSSEELSESSSRARRRSGRYYNSSLPMPRLAHRTLEDSSSDEGPLPPAALEPYPADLPELLEGKSSSEDDGSLRLQRRRRPLLHDDISSQEGSVPPSVLDPFLHDDTSSEETSLPPRLLDPFRNDLDEVSTVDTAESTVNEGYGADEESMVDGAAADEESTVDTAELPRLLAPWISKQHEKSIPDQISESLVDQLISKQHKKAIPDKTCESLVEQDDSVGVFMVPSVISICRRQDVVVETTSTNCHGWRK